MKRSNGAKRGGFTLIELLVVMVIIGMLVALITMAVFQALTAAREAEHKVELQKLAQAMSLFRDQFGGEQYPPDGTGGASTIQKFARNVFPDRRRDSADPPSDLNPAKALVYWLTEVNKDPGNPFGEGGSKASSSGKESESKFVFMQLDKSRLKQGMYYPPGSTGDNPPYVYFQYETYDRATYTHVDGSIKPYEFDRAVGSQGSGGRNFAAPDSIQIISAGLDRKLGKGGKLLSESASGGDYIAEDDEDNMVSFDTRKVGDIRQ